MLKEHISSLLPKNKFARSVGTLVGGTLGSQVLAVLASPLLTRLYGPTDFGLLAVFAGTLAIFSGVAAWRYEQAILLPAEDAEAANIIALSITVVTISAAVVGLLAWMFGEQLAVTVNAGRIKSYLWILPIGVWLLGCYQIFSNWALRKKRFSIIASTRIRQSVATISTQTLGYSFGPISLLLGQSIGQAAGTMSLVNAARADGVWRWISKTKIKLVAKRYRRFPLFDTWYSVFNTVSLQIVPILFSLFFGPAIAGLYALAQRVLTMPLTMVGTAVANVFFSNAVDEHRGGRLGNLVARVNQIMAHIAMPPVLVLALAGPDLFAFVFGEQWREAGVLARWLSPWLYAVFISTPISTVFIVLERQAEGAIFQGGLLVIRVAVLWLGAKFGGAITAVALFGAASAVMFLLFVAWVYKACGIPVFKLFRTTIEATGIGVLVSSPLALVYLFTDNLMLKALGLAFVMGLTAFRYRQIYLKHI